MYKNANSLETKVLCVIGQEESRSLSTSVSWGKRKRFADGKFSLPYGRFLGYEKGEDGLPKIAEKEARVVRLIYKLFLEGKTPSGIAKHTSPKKRSVPRQGRRNGMQVR